MRTRSALLAAVLVATPMAGAAPALAAGGTGSAGAGTNATSCSVTWGSLAKSARDSSNATVSGVRAGRHTCYDRLAIDLRGSRDGYRVAYVSQVYQEGSGAVVPLRGGARLQVTALSPAYSTSGNPTYVPANPREVVDVTGYQTFRQVAWAGSYEGQTTLGLGVRARLPFRAFTLDAGGGKSTLVIDVARSW